MSRDASKYYTITLHVLPGTAESGKQSSVIFGMPFYEKDQRRAGNADRTQASTSHTIQGTWRLHPVGSCVSPVCCPFQPLARCPQSLDSLHPPQGHLHPFPCSFFGLPSRVMAGIIGASSGFWSSLPFPASWLAGLSQTSTAFLRSRVRCDRCYQGKRPYISTTFPRLSTCNFHHHLSRNRYALAIISILSGQVNNRKSDIYSWCGLVP